MATEEDSGGRDRRSREWLEHRVSWLTPRRIKIVLLATGFILLTAAIVSIVALLLLPNTGVGL